MLLQELVCGIPCEVLHGSLQCEVRGLCWDSRKARPGDLFVCIAGAHTDSHALALRAVAGGAAALAVQHPVAWSTASGPVTVLHFADTRRALALLAARWYHNPARQLTMVGITGTKGKTTTAALLAAALTAGGHRVGVLGTNGVHWPGHQYPLCRTTPESADLHRWLRAMADDGCDTCVMEVSSQGIQQQRVAGLFFQVGVFTNLSPDHIGPGEHANFAEYRACKAQLFRHCAVGVVNADDPNTEALLQGHCCRVVRYGFGAGAAYRGLGPVQPVRSALRLGVRFGYAAPGAAPCTVELGMPGQFSAENALAALTAAAVLGVPGPDAAAAMQTVAVAGRAEVLDLGLPFTVVVDYAHNAAAAQTLLGALRAYRPRRLVVVFGCGGGRSALRRIGMGEVCARLADLCILTEDNSRMEPLEHIWAQVRAGRDRVANPAPWVEIPDRLEALHYALDHAGPGDLVAVLGKGHEATLDRGGVVLPFPEPQLLAEYAATLRREGKA